MARELFAHVPGMQSALEPKGPVAEQIHQLWTVMWVGALVVFVVVLGLLAWALTTRSGDPRTQRPLRWVVFGAVLTTVSLVALLVYSAWLSREVTTPALTPLVIEVTARQWWWQIEYPADPPSQTVRTANELHVPVGRPVEVRLSSPDVIHSFWVPNLAGKMDAIPGRDNRLRLQADVPGVYRGQCTEFCGLQHANMAFYVVAESPEAFEQWRARQLLPAPAPGDEAARQGQQAFLEGPCALCHTIRGTGAAATTGPDLTHVASRLSLAAGALINQRGALAGWILDPQHVKPGTFMPPSELEPARLGALLHYLESLQ